jgi:hypothetical protein
VRLEHIYRRRKLHVQAVKHDINVHEEHIHFLKQMISEDHSVNVENTVHDEQAHVHHVVHENIAEHELTHVILHEFDIMQTHHVNRRSVQAEQQVRNDQRL